MARTSMDLLFGFGGGAVGSWTAAGGRCNDRATGPFFLRHILPDCLPPARAAQGCKI